MASNLIFRIVSEFDSRGIDDAERAISDLQSRIGGISSSASSIGSSFQGIATTGIKPLADETEKWNATLRDGARVDAMRGAILVEQKTNLKDLANYQKQMRIEQQQSVVAGQQLVSAFSGLKAILVGAALTLPLTAFINEAIRSEEVAARFSAQLGAMGQSVRAIQPQLDATTERVRSMAGITQTELISALAQGLRFFKDTGKELALLDTAIGLTKVGNISLGAAFRQLGLIQQGNTRYARLYGIEVDKSIKDPTERANKVIADMTAKYAPLAKQLGTAAEQMKIFRATMSDLGEKIGSSFNPAITATLKAVNSLPETFKLTALTSSLLSSSLLGIGITLGALSLNMTRIMSLVTALKASHIAWSAVLSGPVIASIVAATVVLGYLFSAMLKAREESDKLVASLAAAGEEQHKVLTAVLGDLGTEVSLFENLDEEIRKLTETYDLLIKREKLYRDSGRTAKADEVAKEASLAKDRIDNLNKLEEAKVNIGVASLKALTDAAEIAWLEESEKEKAIWTKKYQTLLSDTALVEEERVAIIQTAAAELRKIQENENELRLANALDLETLRIEVTKRGIDAEIALREIAAVRERTALTKQFGDSLDARKLLVQKTAKEEMAIREKYAAAEFDKELAMALKSKDEQIKYAAELEASKNILGNVRTAADIKNLSDAEKEILKTEGGSVALEAFRTKQITQQAEAAQRMSEIDKRIMFYRQETALAAERAKLVMLDEVDLGKRIAEDGWDAGNAFQLSREAQRQKVALMEDELKKQKELKGIYDDRLGAQATSLDIDKEKAAKIEFTTNVNLTVTPSSGDFANMITTKVREQVSLQYGKLQAETQKRLGA